VSPGGKGAAERLFVAILLPDDLRSAIRRVAERVRSPEDGFRWGSADAYHLTVRFIGAVEPGRVSRVGAALCAGVREVPRFDLVLRDAGAFPSPARPRVIWVGVERSSGLSALREAVESALARSGFERESRPFSPHVTIARARDARRAPDLRDALREARLAATTPVRSIALVRSHLSPRGARHETLATCSLAPPDAM